MYTTEEADTFRFCISRWTPDEPVLHALAQAMERSDDPRGVTVSEVASVLRGWGSGSKIYTISRVLGQLARNTREHGVPIAAATDAAGTLRYLLSAEQVNLIRGLGERSAVAAR